MSWNNKFFRSLAYWNCRIWNNECIFFAYIKSWNQLKNKWSCLDRSENSAREVIWIQTEGLGGMWGHVLQELFFGALGKEEEWLRKKKLVNFKPLGKEDPVFWREARTNSWKGRNWYEKSPHQTWELYNRSSCL